MGRGVDERLQGGRGRRGDCRESVPRAGSLKPPIRAYHALMQLRGFRGLGLRFRVQGAWCSGYGFRVSGFGFRFQGLGFRGFRV